MAMVQRQVRITAQTAGRADRVVQDLTGLSRRLLRGLFDQGCVSINDAPCHQPQTLLSQGDRLDLHYDSGRRYQESLRPREDAAYRIVFEDEHLIVVDKAAYILTVPTVRKETNTLLERLSTYLSLGRRPRLAQVIHRLDRGASGLLVFGKSSQVAQDLISQFALHKPHRRYDAIVAGNFNMLQGTFESRLVSDRDLLQHSTTKPGEGELAVTHYQVKAKLRGATWVSVNLETGRRNQIRVHFAESGHPVLGDRRYRPQRACHPHWRARRMALHAAALSLTHPLTRQELRFQSPLPLEMARFIQKTSVPPDASPGLASTPD